MRHRPKHGPHCGCVTCRQQIIYPTKVNQVDTYSESIIEHIHPSHTNVVNHHLVKNEHLYPHSTSYQNTCNSVDTHRPPFQVPAPGQVAGAMSPGMTPGFGPGQVAGAMTPGHGPGQVAGAMHGGHHGGMKHGHHGHHGHHCHHGGKHSPWGKGR